MLERSCAHTLLSSTVLLHLPLSVQGVREAEIGQSTVQGDRGKGQSNSPREEGEDLAHNSGARRPWASHLGQADQGIYFKFLMKAFEPAAEVSVISTMSALDQLMMRDYL